MAGDVRIYVLDAEHFSPALQREATGRNCGRAAEGQDFFHRIATGEVYLTDGERDYCLNCAVAQGLASRTRPTLAAPQEVLLPGLHPKPKSAGGGEL